MINYEVNQDTVAIIGINDNSSKIIEARGEYIIEDNCYSVMDYSCQYFGSSYLGRLNGSKNMLDAKYKLPIIVEESSDLIFFPTSSPESNKCIWINLDWYKDVYEEDGKTFILLKNGEKIECSTSKYSIKNQMMRAARLNFILDSRKLEKNK